MKYTLLYICIAFLFSCGTSKRSVESKSDSLISVSISDSILRKDSVMSLEQLLHSEHLQAHIIVTEWSEPDSSGQQFPIRTTEVDLNRQKEEQTIKSEQSGSEINLVKKEDSTSHKSEVVNEEVKKDTRLIPTWTWWLIGIACIVSLLFVLKRRL